MDSRTLPAASLRRLCSLWRLLEDLEVEGRSQATSAEMSAALGVNAASLRRDIASIGELGPSRAGYNVQKLKAVVSAAIGTGRPMRACVVGLNWLGRAILTDGARELTGFSFAAGFDANTNRRETTPTAVPLYSSDEAETVARRERIEIALVTALPPQGRHVVDALVRGGVRGILNLSGRPVPGADHACSGSALLDELNYLRALLQTDMGGTT
jgi:redox-sensing transcriptional repressor